MDKNIFSGLEGLGIDTPDDINLFKKTEENQEATELEKVVEVSEDRQKIHLYDKEVKCPVCDATFKAKMVKSASPRISKKDSDFYNKYDVINPYFYDVWVCNCCGYASMKVDFLKIKEHQKDLVRNKISTKWQGKAYPDIYDVNTAVERYKFALYNSAIIEASSSRKAMNCLKIAWMYRILEDSTNETYFIQQALEGFNDAFINESTPLYGMDHGTLMYLIGELYRRVGEIDNANLWFSKLITSTNVDQKIKEMARNQRDLIKEMEAEEKKQSNSNDDEETKTSKKGFFSKLFK